MRWGFLRTDHSESQVTASLFSVCPLQFRDNTSMNVTSGGTCAFPFFGQAKSHSCLYCPCIHYFEFWGSSTKKKCDLSRIAATARAPCKMRRLSWVAGLVQCTTARQAPSPLAAHPQHAGPARVCCCPCMLPPWACTADLLHIAHNQHSKPTGPKISYMGPGPKKIAANPSVKGHKSRSIKNFRSYAHARSPAVSSPKSGSSTQFALGRIFWEVRFPLPWALRCAQPRFTWTPRLI